MTCEAPLGCTTQFCFHCLSMNPHCGTECKKPKEANILRQKWKKERTERQKLTYETARQFQSNTETKQANEEHKRELREATESKTAMEVNLFEMRLYDKQMELEQVELEKCEVELEREKTKQAATDAYKLKYYKAANVTERKIVKVRRDDDLDQVNMNTDSRNGMFELDLSL